MGNPNSSKTLRYKYIYMSITNIVKNVYQHVFINSPEAVGTGPGRHGSRISVTYVTNGHIWGLLDIGINTIWLLPKWIKITHFTLYITSFTLYKCFKKIKKYRMVITIYLTRTTHFILQAVPLVLYATL